MPIGILEGTSVATPKCVVRRVGDRRARCFDLCHNRIHFGFACDIVAKRKFCSASRTKRNFGFMGERCAGPNGEFQAMLKFKEGDGSMLELRADDALRRQTEPIAIEPQRPLQIVDTKRNDRDPRLYSRTCAPLWRTKDKKFPTGYVSERKVSRFRGGLPRAAKRGSGFLLCILDGKA
jgi:hypothetical protein